MARVNITVPDEVLVQARANRLNVSQFATLALIDEIDRRTKTRALDAHLAQLERELGAIPPDEQREAAAWADRVLRPTVPATPAKRRRSA